MNGAIDLKCVCVCVCSIFVLIANKVNTAIVCTAIILMTILTS